MNIDFLKPISLHNKMRIGPPYDGGYVVYEPTLADTTLLTYGVGWDVSFEENFNKITGNKVIMFDPTMYDTIMLDIDKIKRKLNNFQIKELITYLLFVKNFWMKKQVLKWKKVLFVNEGIDTKKSVKYDTLANHLQQYQLLDKQLLLKIDVEGKEYELFEDDSMYNNLDNVSQLLIEF